MKLLGPLLLALAVVGARADDLPPINATPTGFMLPGKMIWADLYTVNPTSEIQFYTGLFGWTAATSTRPSGAVYTILSNNQLPVAGVVSRPAPKGDTGSGHWITYVAVADVNQVLSTATGLGGRVVHPARTVAQRGTQAILADSQGSLLGVMHSASGDPDDTEPAVGSWAWAHLSARNPTAASQFYHAVFGYDAALDTREGRQDVYLLSSQGFTRASISPIPDRAEAYPDWLAFVRVDNLDDTISKATALGAHVLLAPKPTDAGTRLAILADPADVAIGLVEMKIGTAMETRTP
jgi:predicted enzyme related to lactoylglutathione lyase